MPNTITVILQSESSQISKIARDQGSNIADDVLSVLILDLAQFCNVGKNFNEFQLKETVRLIRDEYYYLKVDDFKLCFDWIKKGRYGTLYDRLDGAIILEILIKYTDQRASESLNLKEKQHRETMKQNANVYEIFNSPGLRSVLEKVHDEVKDKMKFLKQPEVQKPPLQFSELESYMEYLWETVKDNHSYTVQGITVAKVKGKEYTREEYLKKKYRQYGMLQERRMKSNK